jgi:hypothetical protein
MFRSAQDSLHSNVADLHMHISKCMIQSRSVCNGWEAVVLDEAGMSVLHWELIASNDQHKCTRSTKLHMPAVSIIHNLLAERHIVYCCFAWSEHFAAPRTRRTPARLFDNSVLHT